ncbi:MAG: pseudouridine-5'-phosphate glycosidase [Anaerolineales bacterium]|nr:pseudouridine-5'-phosphate glycosidase [Anaerolineales bacterium]MCB8952313.1 pseudouridine-5'-phosphate glycosidase [Ardenticatenales bacterium]
MNQLLHFLPEVEAALRAGAAVVALESTLITHGLPFPRNVETAAAIEAAVREVGAVPATIAILSGRIHVGLTAAQLSYLGQRPPGTVRKCSRRDLPLALALGEDGATTVAGTMIVAREAGIELFATGGIGGVHRGHPFDVSADLRELGRTPVTVVCSGAKSILDLAATREVLETNGVTVVGYGTDEMPAFYSPTSGLPVDARLDTPAQVAALVRARRRLDLQSATLVTVPVPADAALSPTAAESAIVQATQEADAAGIHGPAATPWLLQRVLELTDGASLEANTALLRHNAGIAARIARVLSEE